MDNRYKNQTASKKEYYWHEWKSTNHIIEKTIEKSVENNAIDLLIALIVEELSEDLNMDPDEVFSKFISSKTGELPYDGEAKLWCDGPSYIAEMYKEETGKQEL